ncbi:hypothetical protein FQN52_002453 [Onygenales sp. PD_12]|nr:hypothetical protein FQN52_002453 [Onygenales sp. PD_12]
MSPHHTPSVTYIPPQPTPLTSLTSTPRARDSPLALAWRDIRTLFSVLYLLPKLCQPSASSNPSDELSPTGPNACHLALLVCVTALQSVLFPAAVVVGVVVPGFVSGLVWAGLLGVVWVLCWPVQGGMVVESRVGVAVDAHRHKGERWVFVNGMMVGHRGLLNNCDRLSLTFRRPITGIHNPTYGLLWDLLECIFQRAFAYNTYATRYTYDHLKTTLADPAVHKVVLLAHSQGGIIVSMALDMLFTDLPPANIAKLEVYTFGSAAAHFNNPLRAIIPSPSPSPSRACTVLSPARVIRHIEHYVNNEDIVPRWGVLWNIRDVHTRYSGKVFIRNHATGHMFNQHYLANIFPLRTDDQGTPGEGLGGGEDGADDGRRPGLEAGFLDRVVMVDERTCREREVYAMEMFGLASGNRQGHTAVVGSEDEEEDEGGDESLAPSRDLPNDNDNLVPKLRVVSNGNGTANTNPNANATANGAVVNPNINPADDQQQPHPQQDLDTDDSAVTSPGPSSISNGHGVCGYDHDHHGENNNHNHQLIDDGDGDGAVGGTGKTVRELSRLWRYLGGGVPGD